MSISDPFDLFFALYVRDTAGILGAEDIAALCPAVPGWSTAYSERETAALTEQWSTWWTALLTDRTEEAVRGRVGELGFSWTVGAPELRAAQEAVFRPACAWRNANRFDERNSDYTAAMMPTYLVAELEREAGRKAPPFAYSVEVVPTDAIWSWDLSPTWVLLSENLYGDTAAFRETLRPRLIALIGG
jgi:hypothetical protein